MTTELEERLTEHLKNSLATMKAEIKEWIDWYFELAKADRLNVKVGWRGYEIDGGDKSGSVEWCLTSEIVLESDSLCDLLSKTYTGNSTATYQSGMGLQFESYSDVLYETINQIVWDNLPSWNDDDDDEREQVQEIVIEWESILWDQLIEKDEWDLAGRLRHLFE